MITLGIDPGPSLTASYFVAVDEQVNVVRRQQIVNVDPTDYLAAMNYDAVVIEWIDERAGIYTGVRSRATNILLTHEVGALIKSAFTSCGVPVYCVPRREVLRQSKVRTRNADRNVLQHLSLFGYLEMKSYVRTGDGKLVIYTETPGLTKPGQRDALMAALFNWRDPRNQQYKIEPNVCNRSIN